MPLLAPAYLEAALRGPHPLSVALSAAGFGLGLLLWLLGWRGHRFWIVLAATVGAGVAGLAARPGAQPLVAGLLLAVAAGALALALVRVVAFAAGGLAAWWIAATLVPAWRDEWLLCGLVGGLVGLVLFRLWTMALTSLAGTFLMGLFGLCLAERLGKVDAVGLARDRVGLLNGILGGTALAGLLLQWWFDRRRRHRPAAVLVRHEEEDERPRRPRRPTGAAVGPYGGEGPRPWWDLRRVTRRAG